MDPSGPLLKKPYERVRGGGPPGPLLKKTLFWRPGGLLQKNTFLKGGRGARQFIISRGCKPPGRQINHGYDQQI